MQSLNETLFYSYLQATSLYHLCDGSWVHRSFKAMWSGEVILHRSYLHMSIARMEEKLLMLM